jgi:hypothetical protein
LLVTETLVSGRSGSLAPKRTIDCSGPMAWGVNVIRKTAEPVSTVPVHAPSAQV